VAVILLGVIVALTIAVTGSRPAVTARPQSTHGR
jgi:hypothetical protein